MKLYWFLLLLIIPLASAELQLGLYNPDVPNIMLGPKENISSSGGGGSGNITVEVDPHWSANFTNMQSSGCPVGFAVTDILGNGTFVCSAFSGGIVNPFNQSLNTTDSPTFAGLNLTGELNMRTFDIENVTEVHFEQGSIMIVSSNLSSGIEIGPGAQVNGTGQCIGINCFAGPQGTAYGGLSKANFAGSFALGRGAIANATSSGAFLQSAQSHAPNCAVFGDNGFCGQGGNRSTLLGSGTKLAVPDVVSVGVYPIHLNATKALPCNGMYQGSIGYNASLNLPVFCNGSDWRAFTLV